MSLEAAIRRRLPLLQWRDLESEDEKGKWRARVFEKGFRRVFGTRRRKKVGKSGRSRVTAEAISEGL